MKCHNVNRLLIFLLFTSSPVVALESDREQPIYIKANRVEIDKKLGVSIYSGKVAISQGSLKIRGDRVTLHYKKGALNKAVIKGKPAVFQQREKDGQTVVSQAYRMEYYAHKARLFLLEQAKVSQGANSFAGAKIEYDIHKSTVIANNNNSSRGRINAILAPAPGTGQ